MTTTEIICCLQELRKNVVIGGIIKTNFTILPDVKPESFDWILDEAIKALIPKATVEIGTTKIDVDDKTCTTKIDFGETISTNKSDFDDIWR